MTIYRLFGMSRPSSTLPRNRQREELRNPLWKTATSRMDRAYYHNFEDPVREFNIPRPQPRISRTSDDLTITNLNNYPRIERYFINGYESDSSDSAAVEQVTQEFNFLGDERSTIAPIRRTKRRAQIRPDAFNLSTDQPPRRLPPSKTESLNRFLAIFSCVLQILISIGLFVFAILRYDKLFTRLPGQKLLFHDATQAEIGTLFEVRTGTSCFVPTILLFFAGITGLIAFLRNYAFLRMAHAIFAFLTILFWFDAIATVSKELNIYYAQKSTIDSSDLGVFIAVTIVLALDCILLPLLTFIFALRDVAPLHHAYRTWAHVIFALIPMILAGILLGFAVYCISGTMAPILQGTINLVSVAPMHAYGLIELIIAMFLFLVGLFGAFAAFSYSRRLRFVSSLLYTLCLLAIIIYLLNADRIINVTANLRVFAESGITYPVSFAAYLTINLLYLFSAFYLIFLIIFTLYCVYRPKNHEANSITLHRKVHTAL